MSTKPKLLKCKCSPKGCTHWEVIIIQDRVPSAKLKCITCTDEHDIRIEVPAHHKLHITEHEAEAEA